MKKHHGAAARLGLALSPFFIGLATLSSSAPVEAFYVQTNLVSDIPGLAKFTDPDLMNPWGMSASPTGSPIWVSDNRTGLATLYTGAGVKQGLVVTVPPPLGGTPPSAPTGQVFNPSTTNFNNERFIFATEDGTISGFTGSPTAVLNVDVSASGAVYKGLAINTANTLLYATNFHSGAIDVFTSGLGAAFAAVNLGAGAFTDPNLPAGYAPFNIQDFGGNLYVTYAVQDAAKHDDVAGPGNGIVDVYNENGVLLRRLISNGAGSALNSPWGLAIAPGTFGQFSNDLLVGNFGDGVINAFNLASGAFLGTLSDIHGNPLVNEGLWGLKFGSGQGNGGAANVLFFTAGIPGPDDIEDHGLFGTLAVPEPATFALVGIALAALSGARRRRG